MNTSEYRFTLDLQRAQSQISIPVTLGDTAREWRIGLTDGGVPYRIGAGTLAKLEIRRPTGTHLEEFCAVENGDTVRYCFSQNENTAAVEGFHECMVSLCDADGYRLAAARFSMTVSGRVVSTDDVNLSDTDKLLIESIAVSEAARRSAEEARINAEAERLNAENARAEAEAVRASAEEQRGLAESARARAEEQRASNETERNSRFEAHLQETGLPAVTEADEGKTLLVSGGTWKVEKPWAEGGKSAYDYALEGGFEGTEKEFAEKLAAFTSLAVYAGETEDIT